MAPRWIDRIVPGRGRTGDRDNRASSAACFVALLACAPLSVSLGIAPAHGRMAAHRDAAKTHAASAPVWTLTHANPPQETSSAGGVRVQEGGRPNKPNRVFTIDRYNTASPPVIVAQATVSPVGFVVGAFIDPSGTITVIADRPYTVDALQWREGEQPGDWQQIVSHHDSGEQRWYATAETDDSGDIAVFKDARRHDHLRLVIATHRPSGGWTAARSIPFHDQDSGMLDNWELTGDGQIAAIATKRANGASTATMLQMPLNGSGWVDRTILVANGHKTYNATIDVRDGQAAFALFLSDFTATVGIRSSDGTITTQHDGNPGEIGEVALTRSDTPGQARFVLAGSDSDVLVSYDDGAWSSKALPFANTRDAMSENGTILFADLGYHASGGTYALRWRPGASPGAVETVSSTVTLDIRVVVPLDSGEVWMRGRSSDDRRKYNAVSLPS